eukprot:c12267_g2_i1.p1 GENE.c12267_g2_i1~~c12267_g2_i1.p1  ORF type:complete len:837 (+),score=207.66 c12267_g2_i1:49-2559(+)
MAGFPDIQVFRKAVPDISTSVFAWGVGSAQLTCSTIEEAMRPKRVTCLDSLEVTQVVASCDRCIALTASNELVSVNLFDSSEPYIHINFNEANSTSLKDKMTPKRKIVKIACCSGTDTFFALASNGDLLSWGSGLALIGRDVTANAPQDKPCPIKAVACGFADVCVGSTHCVALSAEGQVYSWGIGKSGRLGQGSCEDDEKYPTIIPALKGYQASVISAGWGHSAVLSSDGRAFTWGKNDCGQLGLGPDSGNVDIPRVVRALTSIRLVAAACGAFHTAFLTELGQVYVAGDQLGKHSDTPIHVPLNLWCINVMCGPFHTVAVCQGLVGRQFFFWGKNSSGELGSGQTGDQAQPVAMANVDGLVVLDLKFAMNSGFCVALDPDQVAKYREDVDKTLMSTNVIINRNALSRRKKVHSPSAFSHESQTDLVVNHGSDVFVWGSVQTFFAPQTLAECPASSGWCAVNPYALRELADKKIVDVASSETGALMLTVEGVVHNVTFSVPHTQSSSSSATTTASASGLGDDGDGDDFSLPTPTPPASGLAISLIKPKSFHRQRVRQVACNNTACFAVCENGFLFSWHWHDVPLRPLLLGRESSEENLYSPHIVHTVSNAVVVACGELHVMVLREDMQLMAWGMSRCGQLGLGDTETQRTPQKISALQPYRLVEVAAGAEHSIVVTLDGNVWVWGKSADGQLGLGNEDSVLVPTRVPELTHIVACAAGVKHSVFLNNRGVVFVCGEGIPGQRLMTPTQVKMPFWTVAVWAGPYHTFAVCENPDGLGRDHSTYAWGTATGGALGLADIETCNTPQLVKFLEGKHIMASAFGCSGLGIGVIVRAKKE